jgi:hypothetical protein
MLAVHWIIIMPVLLTGTWKIFTIYTKPCEQLSVWMKRTDSAREICLHNLIVPSRAGMNYLEHSRK